MVDGDLVRETLAGDRGAYRELVTRYRNAIYGLALSIMKDFDIAEDMAQEAFIHGYYRLHTLADRNRFGAWIRTITLNLCRMELRRNRANPRRLSPLELMEIPAPGPAVETIRHRKDAQARVLKALGNLPEKAREAVMLHYLDERPFEEIGRFLGCSANAVKARLHRARRRLKKEMLAMVQRTLSRKRLPPKFSQRIRLQEFEDLTHLTDEELKKLVEFIPRRGGDMPLALTFALRSSDPAAGKLKSRILGLLPPMEREIFKVNLECAELHYDPVREFQREVLRAAWELQKEGSIRPAPRKPKPLRPGGSVEIRAFADLLRLQDWEIQTVFRDVGTRELAIALKRNTPGMEKVRLRCGSNMSDRVARIIEIQRAYLEPTDSEVKACQSEILKTIHRLQDAGVIRARGKPGG